MNEKYKKIIKNQKVRLKILELIRWLPSKFIVKIQYKMKLGRNLNLQAPKRFTEKIQSYKLSYKNDLLHRCVDKYDVREYVAEKGLTSILVKSFGCYSTFNEIDFEKLPNQFVMKTTNGSQTNIICKNKEELNINKTEIQFKNWLKRDQFIFGREWAYKGLDSKILIEELLVDANSSDIKDYKFLCFNGKPEFIIYDSDRFSGHRRNIYDLNWNKLNVLTDCDQIEETIEKPDKLEELINISKILSADFPFVRVDLYYVNSQIYFGELTFYPWSGYVSFEPDEFDLTLGKLFPE
ncbi:ATP-grasp fold amidoligase family protein [Vagococcus carniphilus]|uniref:ATP-grasp fold amidoligase family protein n=1 Tax=Vagococcus carniphilus TaxID=218144 RepID=UPI00288F0167|nr:ATP-grasp fold amidoligase family protein [Vagococcus carniphilus]MDT2848678.1 ATP-grasp fold amidoligase family protein [Vagococcus carniphilus]